MHFKILAIILDSRFVLREWIDFVLTGAPIGLSALSRIVEEDWFGQ